MFSSISPIETFEGRRAAIAASSITPGLAWGKTSVSAATRSLIIRT